MRNKRSELIPDLIIKHQSDNKGGIMKRYLLALVLVSTSGFAGHALRTSIKVNLPLTFIDDITDVVSISEHCSIVSYDKGAIMGEYTVTTYAVGKTYVNKKVVSESIDMKLTEDAHIWCVMPAGMSVDELTKELNKE